jgi:DNA-binding MarR family transcriptional regulator
MPAGKAKKEASRAPEELDDTVLRRFVGYNLKRAYLTVHGDFIDRLAGLELRPTQFSALSLIVDNPDISQTELARALSIERSNTVLVVDDLESRELINRNRVKHDRRTYALRATLKGRRLRDQAVVVVRAHEERVLSRLDPAERRLLIDMLNRIER